MGFFLTHFLWEFVFLHFALMQNEAKKSRLCLFARPVRNLTAKQNETCAFGTSNNILFLTPSSFNG